MPGSKKKEDQPVDDLVAFFKKLGSTKLTKPEQALKVVENYTVKDIATILESEGIQLDELSRGTLKKYITRANQDIDSRDHRADDGRRKPSTAGEKKLNRRRDKGIETAHAKLKEELSCSQGNMLNRLVKKHMKKKKTVKEQHKLVSELSAHALANYVSKSTVSAAGHAAHLAKTGDPKSARKVVHRVEGSSKAANRLADRAKQPTKLGFLKTYTEAEYSKSAVDKAIKRDKRIKGKEAKMIHALLRGRQKSDEPVKEDWSAGAKAAKLKLTPGMNSAYKKAVAVAQDDDENTKRLSKMLKGKFPWGEVSEEQARRAICAVRVIPKPTDKETALQAIWSSEEAFYELIKSR